ncbi:kinesin family member C1 [Nematocida sp. AWRm77]|nr:kinesin family member C1 [Nematocida sp. AWRm77]
MDPNAGMPERSRVQSILLHMENNTASLKSAVQGAQRNIAEILQAETVSRERHAGEETARLREEIEVLRAQLACTRDSVRKEEEEEKEREEEREERERRRAERVQVLEEEFALYRRTAEDKIRRQLAEILELKGQVRVLCRVKPFQSAEKVVLSEHGVDLPERGLSFPFARVWGPHASQVQVFEEIEDLVFSVTKGYSVSILAYGPTGSGKTHTVQGTGTEKGIVFQSVETIKHELGRLQALGWTHAQRVSIAELYNDKLLSRRGFEEWVDVEIDAVEVLFNQAARERRTGSTQCNERSSRSHLILRVQVLLQRKDAGTGGTEEVSGMLCIVDLAGSERLAHSQAEGLRKKEAVEINKSLSALGDVVQAISQHSPHVPYRNSKLTWALKDSLGEGARTAFVINIDPGASMEETVTALRFSKRLQECSLGKHAVSRKFLGSQV